MRCGERKITKNNNAPTRGWTIIPASTSNSFPTTTSGKKTTTPSPSHSTPTTKKYKKPTYLNPLSPTLPSLSPISTPKILSQSNTETGESTQSTPLSSSTSTKKSMKSASDEVRQASNSFYFLHVHHRISVNRSSFEQNSKSSHYAKNHWPYGRYQPVYI